jgi:two-component system phosphate regulon sensor histidine kinase PhoR
VSALPLRVGLVTALTTGVAVGLAALVPDRGAAIVFGLLCAGIGGGAAAWMVRQRLEAEARRQREVVGAVRAMGPGSAPAEVPRGWSELGLALRGLAGRHREELQQLQRRHDELREVLDRSALGLVLIDPEGVISYANPAVRTLFRLRSSPVGRRPLEVLPAIEVHEVVEAAARGEVLTQEFATGWGDLSVRAERFEGGTVVVRLEDITAGKEAERARSDFVANVSHELRTPITALMGYAETLLSDPAELSPTTANLLATVERNARRLRDLFEDLLRLHRIETRLKQLPLEAVPLDTVLVDAVIDAADEASLRGQDFELDVPEGLVAWANADALSAIVSNLARNAVSYTPDGGSVKVSARSTADGGVEVSVTDDGIGIAAAHHERIFERFYRVDEARSRRAGGTGLGLAIVKHYALAMGCAVDVKSARGEGSRFTVKVPPRRR